VRSHKHPKQVIISKGKKILGFHFCEYAPNCDVCYFLLQQVAIQSSPNWMEGQRLGFSSLTVDVIPENPYILSEHVKLYLSEIIGSLPKSTIHVLRKNELSLGFQFISRTDWHFGFYMKVNLFFKEVLPNELIQELGLLFFLNNLTNREVHAEFGEIGIFDSHHSSMKIKEGIAILNVYELPMSYQRDYSFMIQSGIQPLYVARNGGLSSPIFDWILEYS